MDKPSNPQVADYRAQARAVAGSELAALGSLSDDFVLACAEGGEAGDAELFIHLFRDQLTFDCSRKKWFLYVGPCWQPDEVNEALALVGSLADHYLKAAKKYFFRRLNAEKAGDEKAAKAAAWAEKILMGKVPFLRRRQHRANVLVIAAAGQNSLGMTGKEWDAKPNLLACLNGVIDRGSRKFRDGRPADFITKYCPVLWEGFDHPATRWEAFLKEIMDGDLERVSFLKRVFGYIISGTCIEHVFIVLWGIGRNGKGTLIEIISEILGSKATPVPAEMLLQQKYPRSAGAPSPEIIALMGILLAIASEIGEGRHYDAGRLKWYTGGDTLTGREAYGSLVSFKPSHTLVLLTNYKPSGNEGDEALWARILSVRFPLKFVDSPTKPHERQKNKNLRDELLKEAPGILAWMVGGYYEWLAKGLAPPASILAETDEYRRSDDSIQQFINECCTLDQGNGARAQELFEAYGSFCEETGFKPKGKKRFFQRMEKEFTKDKDRNGIYYKGLYINGVESLV